MKIFKLLIASTFCICTLLTSCSKQKEDPEITKLKEQVLVYKKLDQTSIKQAYHSSEVDNIENNIQDQCHLLNIHLAGIYLIKQEKFSHLLNLQTIQLEGLAPFASIQQFIKWVNNQNKYMNIKELKISSRQTGFHQIHITLEFMVKDYYDRDFIPSVINSVAGITLSSKEYLEATIKVYKSRNTLVNKIINQSSFVWTNQLKELQDIPQHAYLIEWHYLRNQHEEQVKIITNYKPDEKIKKSVFEFFQKEAKYKSLDEYKNSISPIKLENGLEQMAFIYQKKKD